MNMTQIKLLIDGVKNSADDPNKITEETNKIIKDISETMIDLSGDCYSYMKLYDNYQYENIQDAQLIKDKLKEHIMKVSDNDI